MRVSLGERIRYLRRSRGMTQKELALQLHVSHCAISRYEMGRAEPELSTLDDLSRLFRVDYNYLMDYRGSREISK